MTFKAMRLDERDVLVGVDEIESEEQLTERHVDLRPLGGSCDRKPGQYRWSRERRCLEPLPRQQRAIDGTPTMEQAFAFHLIRRALEAGDAASSQAVELTWLDAVIHSVDFSSLIKTSLVQEYIRARGLNPTPKA